MMDSSSFYSDPRNMFNLMQASGLPMPSDFPSASEVRNQARHLTKSIFDSWNTLQAVLDKREEALRKRWMKKTKEQRTKILLFAWPNMPASHRPDFQALLKAGPRQDRSTLPDGPFKWPYVNLEDLTQGRSLLLLLNTRGRHLPETFAHADLEALHVGITGGFVQREFLNDYTMYLARQRTPDTYGKLVSWDDDDRAFDFMHNQIQFSIGDGLLVLQVQDKLYKFLVKCCCQIFQDVPNDKIIDETLPSLPEPPPIVASETSYAQVSSLASEAPYRVPYELEPNRLKLLVATRRAAAVDHLFDLREDPAYFAATVTEWADHREERMRDIDGKRHPHDDDTVFWDRVLTSVVIDAFESILCYDVLHHKVSVLEDLDWVLADEFDLRKPLAEKLEEALIDIRFTLSKFSDIPINNLRMGAPASPPLRSLFERTSRGLGKSSVAPKLKRSPAGDPLLILLTQLWNEEQVFLLRLTNLVDELQRVVEKDQTQKARISPWVAKVFSDLALLAQLMHQIDIFYPWSAGFLDKIDLSKDERSSQYNREMKAIHELHAVMQKCPSLAGVGAPSQQRFQYPAERRRNEANTKAMQLAERNLDAFWKIFDDHYKKQAGRRVQELLRVHGVEMREIRRTPDWTPRMRERTQPSSEAITDSVSGMTISEPEKAPGRQVPEPEKIKAKTRGVADPSKEVAETPMADAATPPLRETVFAISKRAYKVFSSLFYTPGDQDQAPGEVPWADFMHAMNAIGFEIEKRYGSAWQFSPRKLDVDTPIQFHEPHPSGKIRWDVARRIGRRLTRNYGLTAESFEMA